MDFRGAHQEALCFDGSELFDPTGKGATPMCSIIALFS